MGGNKKEKYKNRSPLKFGEDAIQKLPLHQLRVARASVEVIRILVNDIFNEVRNNVYYKFINNLQQVMYKDGYKLLEKME